MSWHMPTTVHDVLETRAEYPEATSSPVEPSSGSWSAKGWSRATTGSHCSTCAS